MAETAGDNKRNGSYAEWVTIKKEMYGVRVCVAVHAGCSGSNRERAISWEIVGKRF